MFASRRVTPALTHVLLAVLPPPPPAEEMAGPHAARNMPSQLQLDGAIFWLDHLMANRATAGPGGVMKQHLEALPDHNGQNRSDTGARLHLPPAIPTAACLSN